MSDKLDSYRKKRDFTATAEPNGGRTVRAKATKTTHPGATKTARKPDADAPHFVIQHHLARADHYDFRLEIDGVLVSWAVPKGPSTDPRVRRMAVRTEDHPLEYETFEGVIGARNYGGGTVLVWDRGSWENTSNDHDRPLTAVKALERGHLSFVLSGEKLTGGWSLIRLRDQEHETWLLLKKAGAGADARRRPTSTQPESVLTGRTMEEIAADGKDD